MINPDRVRCGASAAALSCLLIAVGTLPARAANETWTLITPGNMAAHSLVWDAQADRVILSPGTTVLAAVVRAPLALPLADPPDWSRLAELPVQLIGHGETVMVLDPRRQRLIFYDGYHNTVWTLPLEGHGAWRQLGITGELPAPRRYPTLVLDESRDRLILYGGLGYGGNLRAEVWVLPLQEPTAWSQLVLPEGGPAPRCNHCAAFDPGGDRMLVFGGDLTPSWPELFSNETWALDFSAEPRWTLLTPAVAPPARQMASLVHDHAARRLLLYGGWDDANRLGDIWSLALDTGEWVPIVVPGGQPGARADHGAAMDTLRHRMIVFGGYHGGSETWALALDGVPFWERLSVLGVPPARTEHVLVADAERRSLIMFGGRDAQGARNDLWQQRLATNGLWLRLPVIGGPPPPRWDHVAVMDSARHRVLVHGGRNEGGLLGDLWALELGDTARWRAIAASGDAPSPRAGHAGVIDVGRDALLLQGGDDGALCDDLWSLALGQPSPWWRITQTGDPPAARRDHTLVLDAPRNRLILYGGDGQDGPLDDVWQLRLPGVPEWARLAPSGEAPGPRRGHAAVFDWGFNRMVVFGGDNGTNRTHRSFALQLFNVPPDSCAWRQMFPREPLPSVRVGQALCQLPGFSGLFMCGGEDSVELADTWRMDYSYLTPVTFAEVRIDREGTGARLTWRLVLDAETATLRIHRRDPGGPRVCLTTVPLAAPPEGAYFDGSAPRGAAEYWIEDLGAAEGAWHGPFPLVAAPLPASLLIRATAAPDGESELRFDLPSPGFVRLQVYDLRGRLVTTLVAGDFAAGSHVVHWDGRGRGGRPVASGIYFARLKTEAGDRAVSLARVR